MERGAISWGGRRVECLFLASSWGREQTAQGRSSSLPYRFGSLVPRSHPRCRFFGYCTAAQSVDENQACVRYVGMIYGPHQCVVQNAVHKSLSPANRPRHNQTLLWTGPRRDESLFVVSYPLARRVTRHRALSVMQREHAGGSRNRDSHANDRSTAGPE
jgi:hypothetical protein